MGKFGKEPHFYLLFPGFPNLVSKLETAVIHVHDARISTVVTTISYENLIPLTLSGLIEYCPLIVKPSVDVSQSSSVLKYGIKTSMSQFLISLFLNCFLLQHMS